MPDFPDTLLAMMAVSLTGILMTALCWPRLRLWLRSRSNRFRQGGPVPIEEYGTVNRPFDSLPMAEVMNGLILEWSEHNGTSGSAVGPARGTPAAVQAAHAVWVRIYDQYYGFLMDQREGDAQASEGVTAPEADETQLNPSDASTGDGQTNTTLASLGASEGPDQATSFAAEPLTVPVVVEDDPHQSEASGAIELPVESGPKVTEPEPDQNTFDGSQTCAGEMPAATTGNDGGLGTDANKTIEAQSVEEQSDPTTDGPSPVVELTPATADPSVASNHSVKAMQFVEPSTGEFVPVMTDEGEATLTVSATGIAPAEHRRSSRPRRRRRTQLAPDLWWRWEIELLKEVSDQLTAREAQLLLGIRHSCKQISDKAEALGFGMRPE